MSDVSNRFCLVCNNRELIEIATYKRYWYLCRRCGGASPVQRQSYPLSFLPYADLKKQPGMTESSIYDYFVQPATIQFAVKEAGEFLERYIDRHNIELRRKRILDISGGNGQFLMELTRRGAIGVLTEINERALEYAKATYGFEVFLYDFNRHRIHEVIQQRFDIVMLRAAIMFCVDIPRFLDDLSSVINPGALVMVHHSVKPTLGTLLRVQLDDYTYLRLRQPETVIKDFADSGFTLIFREDETDQSLYVYDDDLNHYWMFLHYFFEIRGALKLRGHRTFSFPARDRRRSTMYFEKRA